MSSAGFYSKYRISWNLLRVVTATSYAPSREADRTCGGSDMTACLLHGVARHLVDSDLLPTIRKVIQ
jgi:hypothetical protein